jgi:PST family polysaccharide transporter
LQRELRFRSLASVQVASFALGYGLVGVSLAWLGFGAWALVGAQLAQTTLETVILLIIQPHPKRLSLNVRAFKELMYFGGGMTMAKIANYFALQGDNMVVGRWLGADALGFYSRAYRLIALPANLFGEAADKVLFPAMAKVQNEPERLTTAFRRGVVLVSLLVLPASVTIFVLAPEIVYVLLGPNWGGVVGPLQVLSLGIFFRTGYKMSGTLARAKGAVYNFALIKGLYAVLVVGGALIGQRFGLTGVAIGVLGALTVHFFLMSQLSLKNTLMSWSEFLGAHVPALTLTAIVSAVSWGTATLMREFNSPAIVTLSATITVALVCVLIIVRFVPALSIGEEGVWWLQTLSKNLPVNLAKQKS